ncbi:hypothetical protein HDU98_005560 [Podochytrium sp. JEL0797]|nr:hypothetical protein HDU98_005560 [Podochytrium sp. JEL0797]
MNVILEYNSKQLSLLEHDLSPNGGLDSTGSVVICAIACVDGLEKIVGICAMGPNRELAVLPDFPLELQSMYIEPQFQGRGIGRQLMREAIRTLGWTRESGKIMCRVLEGNRKAVEFYERKLGGKVVRKERTTRYGGVEASLWTMGWDSIDNFE